MDSNSGMPELSTAAEGLLDLLGDDNLRIQRSSSGEIGKDVSQLAKELQVRDLFVRNELPDLGTGDLRLEIPEPEATFSNPADSISHLLDLALEMEDDYIMSSPSSPERMLLAPCPSPVSIDEREGEEVFWKQKALLSRHFSEPDVVDDDDSEPIVLKEFVNRATFKMQVEDDGGYEPEIVKEIELDQTISEDDDFEPEILEEVINVITNEGNDEDSDFVEFVEEILKQESEDDDDGYSKNWPPLPSPEFQSPPLSQALPQQPQWSFQRIPTQANLPRLPPPPPPFQRLPLARIQQLSPLQFQGLLPRLPLQQPMMRPWNPFNLRQPEPIQNYWK